VRRFNNMMGSLQAGPLGRDVCVCVCVCVLCVCVCVCVCRVAGQQGFTTLSSTSRWGTSGTPPGTSSWWTTPFDGTRLSCGCLACVCVSVCRSEPREEDRLGERACVCACESPRPRSSDTARVYRPSNRCGHRLSTADTAEGGYRYTARRAVLLDSIWTRYHMVTSSEADMALSAAVGSGVAVV